MHFDFEQAVTRTRLAAAALDIERETARAVAARLGIRRLGEQIADVVEHTRIGRRIGARRASDGRLVDVDDLIEVFDADEFVVRAGTGLAPFSSAASFLYRISLTNEDLPEPETPVTQVSVPSGIVKSVCLRLFTAQPLTVMLLPLPCAGFRAPE